MSLDLEYYSSICDFEIVIDIPELQLYSFLCFNN
jgi:hypothetical protein